jgi:hypothetical protein
VVAVCLGAAFGGCSKPTSEKIQLWKTTEKGPEKLRETVADKGVAPRLRAEAAAAMVDTGRAEEVDAMMSTMSADERAEIGKTLEPLYAVAMKEPQPERALSYRDALYSLRQFSDQEAQKRIDGLLLPALEAELKVGKLRQGRHSLDKMLTAMGADAGAMLSRVLAADVPYLQAAELLAKVGDDPTRDRGSAALVTRAAKIKATDKRPEQFYRALGLLGGPTAIKFFEEKVSGGSKEEAQLATRALGERRDPAVLPFALKVASDPKADKAVRDEMFGVVESIGGLEAERERVWIPV